MRKKQLGEYVRLKGVLMLNSFTDDEKEFIDTDTYKCYSVNDILALSKNIITFEYDEDNDIYTIYTDKDCICIQSI